MDARTNVCMDLWMYVCMDGWMDACMVCQTSEHVKYILHSELES